jgi:predicted Zn-dependent peptidase
MSEGLVWEKRVLPNGLRVLLFPNPSGLTAQVSLAIEYGSNDDAENNSGTAHFLEHMIVGGSQERITLHNEIEKLGGASNFETSEEATFTAVNVFPNKIADASRVLSGLLFDGKFDVDKLELERKVILNEIAEAEDEPWEKLSNTLTKCLFKKHPVKNCVLGTKKNVNQISLQDIERVSSLHYAPRNMILILTGKFCDADVEAVVADFGSRKNTVSMSRSKKEFESGKITKEAVIEKPGIAQAYVGLGFRTAPAHDADSPALDLFNSVLGMGESSRLFRELREKRALTYDFSSMNMTGLDYGFFCVNCAVKAASINKALGIIRKEIEKLAQTPVDSTELEKSKNVVLGDIYRAMDNPIGLPRIMADLEIYFGNEKSLQDYTEKIKALNPKDIIETAQKYFAKENCSTAILKPA